MTTLNFTQQGAEWVSDVINAAGDLALEVTCATDQPFNLTLEQSVSGVNWEPFYVERKFGYGAVNVLGVVADSKIRARVTAPPISANYV